MGAQSKHSPSCSREASQGGRRQQPQFPLQVGCAAMATQSISACAGGVGAEAVRNQSAGRRGSAPGLQGGESKWPSSWGAELSKFLVPPGGQPRSLQHRPQTATMMSLQDQSLTYFLSSWTLCLHSQMTTLKNN